MRSVISDQWECVQRCYGRGEEKDLYLCERRCYSRLSTGREREPLFSGSLGDSYSVLSVTPRRYSL